MVIQTTFSDPILARCNGCMTLHQADTLTPHFGGRYCHACWNELDDKVILPADEDADTPVIVEIDDVDRQLFDIEHIGG